MESAPTELMVDMTVSAMRDLLEPIVEMVSVLLHVTFNIFK